MHVRQWVNFYIYSRREGILKECVGYVGGRRRSSFCTPLRTCGGPLTPSPLINNIIPSLISHNYEFRARTFFFLLHIPFPSKFTVIILKSHNFLTEVWVASCNFSATLKREDFPFFILFLPPFESSSYHPSRVLPTTLRGWGSK